MAEPLLSRMPSPTYDNMTDNVLSRKMKPLPKRRRVSDILFDANDIAATQAFLAAAAAAAASEQGHEELNFPGNLPGSLSDYYMPLLAGMQDILRADLKYATTLPSTQLQPQLPIPALPVLPASSKEDEDHNEYIDHLEQPGNTKKRKVPLVRQTGYLADFIGDPEVPDAGPQTVEQRVCPNPLEIEQSSQTQDKPPQQGSVALKKMKASKAAQAWLGNKEMVKSRKRQLTAVLGNMYNGDSLALDHALSSIQPFAKVISGSNKENARIRLSQRKQRVLARRAGKKASSKGPVTQNSLSRKDFTFSVLCATSERLAAIREEVTTLQAKFEKEWSAQSARNAEAAKRAAHKAANVPTSNVPTVTGGRVKGGSKKKKRSALANASNPHHLRNYVPSRLPNSGPPPSANAAAINQQNLISPLAIRFLSAQLAPRKQGSGDPGKYLTLTATSQLTSPGEEWICPLCEYDLFYGNEARFHRAVRNRKKILKRRRRAREKAAATASGAKTAARAPTTSNQGDEDGRGEGEDVDSMKTHGSDAGDAMQGAVAGGGGGGRLRAPG